jgi:asparagine synthetase B (glutamine-hydrolysing)
MCGICGFMNLDGQPADRAIVERMSRALPHRGPDGGRVRVWKRGHWILTVRQLT